MQLLLSDADQPVVSTDVDVAVASGERGHVQGRQAVIDDRPAPGLAIIEVQTLSQSSGQHIARRHQHGIGVHFERAGSVLELMELPLAVQSQNACTVRPDHPFGANGHDGGNTVVLQTRS